MNISAFCIRHPVTTMLMSLTLVLAGLVAYRLLPVNAMPNTDFPVITVEAKLPGASPEVMAASVATPLIKQLNGIAGVTSIETNNTRGATTITVEFVLNRNIDAAAVDVQAALMRARSSLPAEMPTPPTYSKFNPSSFAIYWLSLKSDTMPLTDVSDLARQLLSPPLSTIDGVARVWIYGEQKRAVRIQIDPAQLAARGIGVDEVQAAVQNANSLLPVGVLKSNQQELIIKADTQLAGADELSRLIIATRDGRPVRLGEVARVVNSVENLETASWHLGVRSIAVGIVPQPGANTIEIVDRLEAMLPRLQAQLPASVTMTTTFTRSVWIRAAIEDVEFTLLLTIFLVVLVVFMFLRRLAATFIASLAVPVSILATLAAMYACGASINLISMLGLTLSVGLVVDDAIVMIENIVRRMEEEKLGPVEAALAGSREIAFTILSISISLVAVFIPVLWMGGVIGRLFHEFAVVVSVAILASAFVSLTLTPMLCARLLKPAPGGAVPAHGVDAVPTGLWVSIYARALDLCLKRRAFMMLVLIATIAGTGWLATTSPKGLLPTEDTGRVRVILQARSDVTHGAMAELLYKVVDVLRRSPHVADYESFVEGTSASVWINLKPQGERANLPVVLADLRRELARVPAVATFVRPIQSIFLGSAGAKSQYQYVLRGLDRQALKTWANRMTDAMRGDPATFIDVTNETQSEAPHVTLIVDKEKAGMLGISSDVLRSALYSGFGERQIATIQTIGETYAVLIELDPRLAWSMERIGQMPVRTKSGSLIPIETFARVERSTGPKEIRQRGELMAVTITFDLPAGVALGTATQRIEALQRELAMPPSIFAGFAGAAATFKTSGSSQALLILAAVVAIYIVLGMLYESYLHPLTIIAGLPSAVLGALASLRLLEMELTVIAVIGLLMLIGIVKKNAIMMIDVALVLQRGGMDAAAAIRKACLLRVRPIMMTTLAALVGALPLAVGWGAGAELRQPLGVAVVGGLVVSQLLTLLITPALYLTLDQVKARAMRRSLVTRSPTHREVPKSAGT